LRRTVLYQLEKYKQKVDYINLGITRFCTGRQFRRRFMAAGERGRWAGSFSVQLCLIALK
jgi:hypothetical protein